MTDINSDEISKVILAKWSDRFLAWLIDFIIMSILSALLILSSLGESYYEIDRDMFWFQIIQYIPTSILFFTYWTILEYKTGQTVGKKILNLKTTDIYGGKPSLKGILVSGFGKSFLLPIDVVLGWVLTNEKRQRIFNKLGGIVVVKIKINDNYQNIEYAKD